MSEGDREDDEEAAWLVARERGQPGRTVSDATAARYRQLQALITDLPVTPDGVRPRADWQQDVLAAIDADEAEPDAPRSPAPAGSSDGATPTRMNARPRRWVVATAIVAMAASAAILLAVYRDSGRRAREPVTGPVLAFDVEPANRPHRSSDPSVGDTLIVRGGVEGPGELRVYDAAGVEQARCRVPAPDCTVERSGQRTTLRLTVPLRVPGALRALLFAAPLGGASGGIDADVEAAMRAGISVTPGDLVNVH
jgi:hypothetical protein